MSVHAMPSLAVQCPLRVPMTFDPGVVASIIGPAFDQWTATEKRDFIFERGIRATAYPDGLPDIHFGVVQFAESAGISFAEGLLRETLTRVGDELDPAKHKLFH